jgi:hypothetical protein
MLAYRQTIDNEVNKSWIARVIRTQTVSLNLEFGIAALHPTFRRDDQESVIFKGWEILDGKFCSDRYHRTRS